MTTGTLENQQEITSFKRYHCGDLSQNQSLGVCSLDQGLVTTFFILD
jgi:hypothetical protein